MEGVVSITDELRPFFADHFAGDTLRYANRLADRIDAACRDKCAASYASGFSDGESVAEDADCREFAKRLEEAAFRRDDVTLFGVDYAPLPVDADGVPIHIGDRVENNERVMRIVLTDGSWEPSVYIEKLPNVLHEHFCFEISHYHALTVEDVLDELFGKANLPDGTQTRAEIIAEYAAKLRLAGEGE